MAGEIFSIFLAGFVRSDATLHRGAQCQCVCWMWATTHRDRLSRRAIVISMKLFGEVVPGILEDSQKYLKICTFNWRSTSGNNDFFLISIVDYKNKQKK